MRPLLLIAMLALAASVSAQTITGYGVIKSVEVIQTSSSEPVDVDQPHVISAYVFGTGLAGTYSFTAPGGSAQNFNGSFEFDELSYNSSFDLDTAFPNGVYSMTLPNNGGSGPQTFNLPTLTGNAYPEVPQILGGTWSGNMLQLDPTQNNTLTFAAFSSFGADDSYALNIRNSSDVTVASGFWNTGGTTTFVVTSGTLSAGEVYSASLRFNNNFIDYGVALPGANGNVGYSVNNEFQIQAIPEPSTYAAIFGALALAGVMLHRRRRTV